MSRFLLVIINAGGAVPPQLAIAKLLLRAGHEVTLLVPPSLEGRAAETGCELVLFERVAEFRFGE